MEETIKNDFELSPSEYFEQVKERKNHITDGDLRKVYDNCLELLNKYKITGQKKGMKKLMFHLECIEKEREIVKMGINTFIYRDDIEEYIDNVAKDTVKIIELENYEREIPDEIVNLIAEVKDKFDQLYVVFTDYTGKIERQIKKERREKDPILFGTFQNQADRTVIDRFYYLGDWVDEFCDLTLDKMIEQYKTKKGFSPANETEIPKTGEELVAILKTYTIDEGKKEGSFIELDGVGQSLPVQSYKVDPQVEKKQGFFSKIRSVFKK